MSSIKNLKNQILEQQQILSSTNIRIVKCKNKITLITSESKPDLDFLEEEAKAKLGLADKSEKALYFE